MGRLLEFRVHGQKLGKQPGCDFSRIVAGSDGYLTAKFNFNPEDWDVLTKVAVFVDANDVEYPELIKEDGGCSIPSEALTGKVFKVYVVGAKDKRRKIQTAKMTVKQEVN